MELTNNYLLYIDANKIYALKPYNKNNYEENPIKERKLKSNIISMAELNTKFCLYCEDKCLYILDSNSFKEKTKITSTINNVIFNKIKNINTDIIAALGDKKIFLISEAKQNIVEIYNDYNIYDIDSELDKLFIVTQNNIIQFDVKVNKEGKYLTKKEEKSIKCKVNILYLLNNEMDEKDKIGKIAFAYNNERIRILLSE